MNTVISKDGTVIAYNKEGNGRAVVLIDGAFCSKDFGPMSKLVPLLSKDFSVITYDRRGRGDSGDSPHYAVEREIEDIDALINMVGGSANLFAISSGAILALKAVAHGSNVTRLAIFEPPFVGNEKKRRPADSEEQLKQLITEGKKGDACRFYLTKVIGVPAIVPFILSLTPNWSKMKANANSLPYDAAVCGDFNLPRELVASVTIPTIVIDSDKSPETLRKPVLEVAEILPNGLKKSLKGKMHDVPPKILVPALVDFYNS